MGKLEDSARQILAEIGGAENITSFTHCATRLRFGLNDASNIDTDKIGAIKGVLAGVPQGDKAYQVVIGGGVEEMFQEINDLPEMKSGGGAKKATAKTNEEVKAEQRQKAKGNKIVDAFFEYLSDSFRPIIGVLLGASIVIAILNVLIACGVITSDTDNTSVLFLKAIAQGVFYFLPIMIAYNAAKKVNVDPWVGAVIMMIVIHRSLQL